jgi:hypothetical protein
MKRQNFYFLFVLVLIACKQEQITPDRLKIQVLEFGTDTPISFAKLHLYKTSIIGNGPAFQLIDSVVTNDVGTVVLPNTNAVDCIAVKTEQDEFYFNSSDLLCGINGIGNHVFYLKSRASLKFSLTDDLNLTSSLHHVEVRIDHAFQNRVVEATLFPNSTTDSLFVFAHEPVEVQLKRIYQSGACTYEYLAVSPLQRNESHHIPLTF